MLSFPSSLVFFCFCFFFGGGGGGGGGVAILTCTCFHSVNFILEVAYEWGSLGVRLTMLL